MRRHAIMHTLMLASLAHAVGAVTAVAGEVHVEMVAVEAVGVRAENCREDAASALVDRAEEGLFVAATVPTFLDRYGAAVGENEAGYVERIGVAMLGELSA